MAETTVHHLIFFSFLFTNVFFCIQFLGIKIYFINSTI